MGTRSYQNRSALLHRLEEKYSQKLTELRKNRTLAHSVSSAHGMHITKNQYLDYEVIG